VVFRYTIARNRTARVSMKAERKLATWGEGYLPNLLASQNALALARCSRGRFAGAPGRTMV